LPVSPISSQTAFDPTQTWCATLSASPPSVRVPAGTNIFAGSFWPGTGEPQILQNQVILIKGDRIAAVGPNVQIPAGTNVIDLSGLRFSAGITYAFTNGTRLNPGQFWVIGRNPVSLASHYLGLAVNGIYTGRLDNGGELIAITNALGINIIFYAMTH